MRFFYVLICCLFLTPIVAQDYLPMLQEGARWHEYYSVGSQPCNFTLQIVGDTIFNGQVYKKIKEEPFCGIAITDGTFRYLRENVTEHKVYEIGGANDEECIIYDFNLSPGDTFFYNLNRSFIILDSISTVIDNPFFCGAIENNQPEINIDNPRIFYFNDASFPVVWIEGVGSLAGLFAYNIHWGGGHHFQHYFAIKI